MSLVPLWRLRDTPWQLLRWIKDLQGNYPPRCPNSHIRNEGGTYTSVAGDLYGFLLMWQAPTQTYNFCNRLGQIYGGLK